MKKVYKRKRILSFGIIDKNGTSWAKDCKITGLNKKVKVLYDFKEGDVVGFANNFVRTKTSLYADLTIDCDYRYKTILNLEKNSLQKIFVYYTILII